MSEHVEKPAEADELNYEDEPEFDALVIGAGAAGVGAAIAFLFMPVLVISPLLTVRKSVRRLLRGPRRRVLSHHPSRPTPSVWSISTQSRLVHLQDIVSD